MVFRVHLCFVTVNVLPLYLISLSNRNWTNITVSAPPATFVEPKPGAKPFIAPPQQPAPVPAAFIPPHMAASVRYPEPAPYMPPAAPPPRNNVSTFSRQLDQVSEYKNIKMGGAYGPLSKIPEKCPLGLKLGRVPQAGINITFKPKKSQPSTYGCHKVIMKIAPQTAFCCDFAELL